MACKHLLYLVVLSIIGLTLQDVTDNKIDARDESPLADVAKQILKEQNLENIGGMVNSFLQSGGGKDLVNGVLQNLASGQNSGQLLETLGSILNSGGDEGTKNQPKTKKKKEKGNGEVNPLDLLSGLGSIVGALQSAGDGDSNPAALLQGLGSLLGNANNQRNGNNAAALLQGLGSLLGSAAEKKGRNEDDDNSGDLLQGLGSVIGAAMNSQAGGGNNAGALLQGLGSLLGGGQGGKGGLNPELIGNMINMFANSQTEKEKPVKREARKVSNEKEKKIKKGAKSKTQDEGFDFGTILNLASTFMNQGKGSGESNFMDYLPMIINTFNSFTGQEAQDRAKSHSDHSWTLPPILERIHVYYDNFVNSDMGKYVQSYIFDQPTFKVFRDDKGNFNFDKFEELIENHSFRRHWIQQLAAKLVDLLQLVSDKKIYNQYIEMGITFTNSFLEKSGFPKKAFIDTKNLAKSITNFANYAAKKYLDSTVDVREYVEPIVLYVKDLLKSVRQSIETGPELKAVTDKLTDTINMEIIEPITRVNRAYRFAKSQPECDRYVFCLVNQEVNNYSESLPGVKKGLYKGSSLIAAWFLTSSTGTTYWDLYNVVTQNPNCQTYHKDKCNGFHEEEIKATTEYVHSEL